MTINTLIQRIKTQPNDVSFNEVMDIIASHYQYTPTRFTNGIEGHQVINEAGTNEGSCKIFAFAKLNNLSKQETLACFGSYYRDDVLDHPDGTDHGNIRSFIHHGWAGIHFDQPALTAKANC
jgi:hypothetical protein